MLYLWLKAGHIIFMVAWMAGLFYLPRLFVYHADCPFDDPRARLLAVMERRLLRVIMNPAMILTWGFGLALLWYDPVLLEMGWLHAKLSLVLVMTGFHMFLARWRRHFAAGKNTHSVKFYRFINEVPTILFIGIVIMVVLKPF